jgi:hypothetical protein
MEGAEKRDRRRERLKETYGGEKLRDRQKNERPTTVETTKPERSQRDDRAR